MNEMHEDAGTLVEEQPAENVPVVEEKKKPVAGGPLKVRNFNLLFGGQTISVIGDALYTVAWPWLVLTTGGRAEELGTDLAAYCIPRPVRMLAGCCPSPTLRPATAT